MPFIFFKNEKITYVAFWVELDEKLFPLEAQFPEEEEIDKWN